MSRYQWDFAEIQLISIKIWNENYATNVHANKYSNKSRHHETEIEIEREASNKVTYSNGNGNQIVSLFIVIITLERRKKSLTTEDLQQNNKTN